MEKEVKNIKSTIFELIGIFCVVFTVATFILPTHVLANDDSNSNSSLRGDVNGDGIVNLKDIIELKLIILGLISPTDNADVNDDGIVNNSDLKALLDLLLGQSSSHGGGGGGGGGGAATTNQVSFNASYISSYGPGTTGQTFTSRVNIAQTSFLYNGSFTIDYNSSVLRVNDVTSGLFATACVINMTNGEDWTEDEGQLTVLPDLSSCATNGSGVSGSGYFCDIEFETIGAGISPLTFGNGLLYQSQSGNISVINGATWINGSAQISQLYSLNITSDDHGNVITPGEAGPYTYSAGRVVNLVATPDTSCYHFVNWTGDTGTIANPNAATTTITMNGDYEIQANFAINTYTLALVASPGAGGAPSLDGENPFTCGTNATINANTNSCYTFGSWSPADGVADRYAEDTTVTMTQNRTLTASYVQTQNTLNMSNDGHGTTTPITGPYTYGCGTNVSVSATAASCYIFDQWIGTAVDADKVADPHASSTTVMVNGNYSLQATFVASDTFALDLVADPSAGGSPHFDGISPFDCGTLVNISANPDPCYTFVNWSGSSTITSRTSANTTVRMNTSYTLTALYTIKRYTLTPAVSPTGAGTVNGSGSYDCNASAQVTANATAPYVFDYWSGGGINGSTNNPENVTMNSSKTVTAVFKTNPNTVYCENVSAKTRNTSFTLKVMALNITPNVAAGQFDLKYDPNIISVANVSAGNIGGTSIPMVWDNFDWMVITSGVPDGKYILRVIPNPGSPASGSGYFCQITFNATAVGTSALEFVEGEGSPSGQLILNDNAFPPNALDVTWIEGSVRVQ
jgi:hypothetical protein